MAAHGLQAALAWARKECRDVPQAEKASEGSPASRPHMDIMEAIWEAWWSGASATPRAGPPSELRPSRLKSDPGEDAPSPALRGACPQSRSSMW